MGKIQIFAGKGQGKSSAALGKAILAAVSGKRVAIIQFLKGNGLRESQFQRRLEPEIQVFRFEKSDCTFQDLPEEKRAEEFAKRFVSLGLEDVHIDRGGNVVEELKNILEMRKPQADIILTGTSLSEGIAAMADCISNVELIR